MLIVIHTIKSLAKIGEKAINKIGENSCFDKKNDKKRVYKTGNSDFSIILHYTNYCRNDYQQNQP